MQWEDREESSNVEDARGFGGGRGILPIGGGIGGIILVIILAVVFGVDPRRFLGDGGGVGPAVVNPQDSAEDEKLRHFTAVILHDTEVVWDEQFQKMGKRYIKPKLKIFSGQVDSACGFASAASGPFYCPGDSHVYIDLSFYRDMQRKLNAPGEFARAYVIAHEVGHHVQHQLGYSQRVDEARRSGDKVQANHMSVRLELQADYFAGVWAYHADKKYKRFLDPGDIASALNAAKEIGDDRLQKKARGYVVPDAFTHGRSDQRMRWFKKGFDTGDVNGAKRLFDLNYNDL